MDERIDAVLVSGYFNSRQKIWNEPIYRNIWGLLTEFGDAEIATLIAPRSLVVEYSRIPPNLENSGDKGFEAEDYSYTGHKGKLETPKFQDVQDEFNRINGLIAPDFQTRYLVEDESGAPVSFWEEVLGKFDDPLVDASPRSRKIYDRELWVGYEVVLDVYEGFIAPGVLLMPKDIKEGEERPVVVVQHGRNGLPEIMIEGNTSYYDIAARLAERGFVVVDYRQ